MISADQPKQEVSRFIYGKLFQHDLELVAFALDDGRLVYGVRAFKIGEHVPIVVHSAATDLFDNEETAKIEIYKVLDEWLKGEGKVARPLGLATLLPLPLVNLTEGDE